MRANKQLHTLDSSGLAFLGQRHSSEKRRDSTESQEEQVLSLLFRASIRLQSALDRYFIQFNMTAQESAMLVICVRLGEVSAGKLARTMLRDKGKITRFVDRLEEREFLVRRSNERDHRIRIICATGKARRVAPHLEMVFREIYKALFSGIPSGELDKVQDILLKLCANAERLYQAT